MKTEIEILNNFFEELSREKILFCVLRNYEEIPDNIGHDVDMLIQKERDGEAQKILEDILHDKGWKHKEIWNKDGFKTIVYYGISEGKFKQIKLDIWTGLNWRGLQWINAEYILHTVKQYKNFYIPTIGCEAAVSMFKELMGGGSVPIKYVPVIEKGVNEEWMHFQNSIAETFLEEHIVCIKNWIDKKDWDSISQFSTDLKKGLIKKAKKKKKIKAHCIFIVKECIFKVKSRIQKGGAFLVFIGPDGSGKTTIIKQISEKFKLIYPYQKVYHTRFELFPELHSGLGLSDVKKKTQHQKEVTEPAKQEEQSMISKMTSWIVVLYYTLEFLVGKIVFFRMNRKGRLVIFDRYYYDFFVQPNTRNLIWKAKKILYLFIPKPDMIIHLYADGQTVYQRKGELNVKEIDLQNSLFEKLLQDDDKYKMFDTRMYSISELVEKIADAMYNELL